MTSTDGAVKPLLPPTKVPLRSQRLNYGKIHSKPFPLETQPLPPLIPHNLLSVLHIALVYIYQHLTPVSSHPNTPYQACFSSETRSIHVTDGAAIRALWECGFFGKGSLSRSEPSWLEREKKRKGLLATDTSEEFTIQRREERKKFKHERARKEREAIEQKLREEQRSRASSAGEPTARAQLEGLREPIDSLEESIQALIVDEPLGAPRPQQLVLRALDATSTTGLLPSVSEPSAQEKVYIENQEHLQLHPCEAFFLSYALGILRIIDQTSSELISAPKLLTLFRSHSYFPPLTSSSLRPDDPFLLSYATYHHFRSLGWVVRPGIKFAVDWLLYLRGPVFSHAEFAVIVRPAYRHPYWKSSEELKKETEKRESKTWWWLHCVNRVQSQVRKSLVICYVEVPPPALLAVEKGGEEIGQGADIGKLLRLYKVRELTLKRWTPNRERD